jgi:hypothetical protein
MTEPTFIIDGTFFIQGRGLVLLALLDRKADPPVRVCVGDEIELALAGGGCVRTTVTGVERVQADRRPDQFPVGLLVSLLPDDHEVLRGAKVRVVR